jgi:hypothetical protein
MRVPTLAVVADGARVALTFSVSSRISLPVSPLVSALACLPW